MASSTEVAPLDENPLQWTPDGVLLADLFSNNRVGADVAIQGDVAVLGAPGDGLTVQSGAAYVYVPGASGWTVEQKLVPPDGVDGDSFGVSVALSGDTAVVGAYRGQLDFPTAQGAAYVFVRSGASWTFQQKLTAPQAAVDGGFGRAVAIDGDQIIVGAPDDRPGGVSSGAAYAYSRTNGVWTETQALLPATPASSAQFGTDIALSAGRALVGAPGAGGGGAATVLRLAAGTWTVEAELHGRANAMRFGQSVALDGDRALVGDPSILRGGGIDGEAYVFARSGATWPLEATFVTPLAEPGHFGTAVALAGEQAYVGQTGYYLGDYTFVFGFGRSGGSWSAGAMTQSYGWGPLTAIATSGSRLLAGEGQYGVGGARLSDPPASSAALLAPADYAYFPRGGAIDEGGAFVSADNNKLYAYEKTAAWSQVARTKPTTGLAESYTLALSPDTALVGVYQPNTSLVGSAIFYARNNGQLSSPQTFSAGQSGNRFAASVALAGDTALIGSPSIWGGSDQRAVVYERSEGVWAETQDLHGDATTSDNEFGKAVALSADTAVVGADHEAGAAEYAGAVYVYTRGQAGFARTQKLTPSAPVKFEYYGKELAFAGDSLLVSAAHYVHVFKRNGATWALSQVIMQTDDDHYDHVKAAGDFALISVTGNPSTVTHVFHRDDGGWKPWQILPFEAFAMSSDRALFYLPDLHGRNRAGVYALSPRPVVCGDGEIGPGEQCDDSNTTSGDGCTATCQDESTGSEGTGGTGGTGGGSGSTAGEAGTTSETDGMSSTSGGATSAETGGATATETGGASAAEMGGATSAGAGETSSPAAGGTRAGRGGAAGSAARAGDDGAGARTDSEAGADSGGRSGSSSTPGGHAGTASGRAGTSTSAGTGPSPRPESAGCACTIPARRGAPASSGLLGALMLAVLAGWRAETRRSARRLSEWVDRDSNPGPTD